MNGITKTGGLALVPEIRVGMREKRRAGWEPLRRCGVLR
jgi:hypothetical protein